MLLTVLLLSPPPAGLGASRGEGSPGASRAHWKDFRNQAQAVSKWPGHGLELADSEPQSFVHKPPLSDSDPDPKSKACHPLPATGSHTPVRPHSLEVFGPRAGEWVYPCGKKVGHRRLQSSPVHVCKESQPEPRCRLKPSSPRYLV